MPVKIHVIPGWIYRSLLRNKFNLIDIQSYQTIRSALSQDDIASWMYLNDVFMLTRGLVKARVSTCFLGDLLSTTSDDERVELQSHITTYAHSEEMAQIVKERLSVDTPSELGYSFVLDGHILYVILNEGFLMKASDSEYLLQFTQEYLKNSYKFEDVPGVSYTEMFAFYVDLL